MSDTVYWHHHSNLTQQAQVMQVDMPTSLDEPIIYDPMVLINAESRFYNVPHHDIFLGNYTPTYGPVSIVPDETLLTTIQYLYLAVHPGYTALDIHQWGAMKPSKFR